MFDVYKLQKELCELVLPSGFERPVAKYLMEKAKPLCDEVYFDTLGSVICHKKGPGKKLMIPAHMDAIGFMATYIDERGFIRFATIGGHSPMLIINTPVVFENGAAGTIRPSSKAAMNPAPCKDIGFDDLFIDIGAHDRADAEKLVKLGEVAKFKTETYLLPNRKIMTPYADDLAGCIVALLAMEHLKGKSCENDLYFVFTVQEELGLRGAKAAGNRINPDYAIALDVCYADDTPEKAKNMRIPVHMGKGPTIKMKDGGQTCNPPAIEHLKKAAAKAKVEWQAEILPGGSTDSAAIQRAKAGALVSTVSIPTRNIHSPAEMYSIDDVENAAKLVAAAAQLKF